MESTFFAAISRMKYIERWALMRSSRAENLSEHSLEVSMIAHVLCLIGNVRYGKNYNADRAAVIGLYHDATEIISGDMPTPVKYYNEKIRESYKELENIAEYKLLNRLPDDLREEYRDILLTPKNASEEEAALRRLVKAADKLSAYIKCIEEENAGNKEFATAKVTLKKALDKYAAELPEVRDFIEDFLPSYGKTLDELS